ncbi:cell wall-binding repeat-containing protein [Candidatus Poriferisodalis sp.]|uniref:cell wall-binding repeat-containing protein n=1 Tax=Candidatus Poriferisodalis sp. TaxID=3101277 RepID=UPI003B01C0F3
MSHQRATVSMAAAHDGAGVALARGGVFSAVLSSGEESPSVPLSVGTTAVTLTVTAEDGTTGTHRVDFVRAALGDASTVTVSTDEFTLSCPAEADEGTVMECTLSNVSSEGQPWPVVGVLHSALDDSRAFVAGDPVVTSSDAAFSKDLSFGEQDPMREGFNFGYGELFSGGSSSLYRTWGYEKFDWSGTAAAGAHRIVRVELHDDLASADDPGATEHFYVALAPSDYSGLSELADNTAPILLHSETGTSADVGGGSAEFDVGTAVLVVANGWSPPDVGVASVLAARLRNAVVVYTERDALSEPTRELLREVLPAEVVIVGGIAAVSRETRSRIRAATPETETGRVEGADRVDTSVQAARRILGAPSGGASAATLIVASGWSPPDIGAAAALAARTPRSAVVYTQPGALPEAVRVLLREYLPARVVIVGGSAAVSGVVEAGIAAVVPGAGVSRVTGADRIETAAQTARSILGDPAGSAGSAVLVLANGWSPPDIGTAAATAARTQRSAVLYTEADVLAGSVPALIASYRPASVVIVGGRAAVSDSVRAAVVAAAPDAQVRRVTGATRVHTAAAAARRILSNVDASEFVPELAFVDDEYFMSTRIRVWPSVSKAVRGIGDQNQIEGNRVFGRVEAARRSGSRHALRFAVEELPDVGSYQAANPRCAHHGNCTDTAVGVSAGTGELFLHSEAFDLSSSTHWADDVYVIDFPPQRVGLSVTDLRTPLKVYRDVMVRPSQRAPDCGDYPGRNPVSHQCLFGREHLPPTPPAATAGMRAALPGTLVQPRENYSLVFAEEFDYTAAANADGACRNRMNNLNRGFAAWNFDTDPCDDVDAEGVPCFDIADGSFYMARSYLCDARMTTAGRMNFKYGYMEVKYSFNYEALDEDVNLSFSLGLPAQTTRGTFLDYYGAHAQDYETVLRAIGGVVNLFEYIPKGRRAVSATWTNPYGWSRHPDTPPLRTMVRVHYCRDPDNDPVRLVLLTEDFCNGDAEHTMTQGLEWTPRGYRSFFKLDGYHDDFVVLRPENVWFRWKPTIFAADGTFKFSDDWQTLEADARNRYFEHLIDGDPDSVLTQLGISHRPMDITFGAWRNISPRLRTIATKLRIDYIRVFQPQDGYTHMDPVYQ